MKVAVTGATGFIGRYVVTELMKLDVEIVAISREKEGFLYAKKVCWVGLDIASPPENCFKAIGEPDVLIHLAWGGLPNYQSLHHFESELPLQYQFLSTLIREGLQSLVVTGTCFEYGLQSGPLDADIETNPSNPYGLAKDTLHRQLRQLNNLHPFRLIWARLFYMYGEGQAKDSLYSSLRSSVERGDKVFKMSPGEQLRDYLPVEDVAYSLADLALQGKGGVLNVCSGQPISIRRLVECWIQKNKWDIDLALGEYPYSDCEPLAFWGVR